MCRIFIKSLIDSIDLLFCVGRGCAEMLFIEAIEGGIVVKSAVLTCRCSIFTFSYKLLRYDKSFRDYIAIHRSSGKLFENSVYL